MGENSKIEWCHHTFNPWIGCTKVSPGCANCYAEKSTRARVLRSEGHETWGKGAVRSLTSETNWNQPLRWNREASNSRMYFGELLRAWGTSETVGAPSSLRINATGADVDKIIKFTEAEWDALPRFRPRVFCASLADWLDDEVPIEWLARLLQLIRETPHLDWLLLTKRPENWRLRLSAVVDSFDGKKVSADEWHLMGWIASWLNGAAAIQAGIAPNPPTNVWIGTTVEDQTRADERIPLLLNIPAAVRFLSCEPLLSMVDLHSAHIAVETWRVGESFNGPPPLNGIHWVICGGESGPKARPMHPDWARSLRDQCHAAGVPFFFKQWGDWVPGAIVHELPDHEPKEICRMTVDGKRGNSSTCPDGRTMVRVGKRIAGSLLDGIEHNGFPSVKGACA